MGFVFKKIEKNLYGVKGGYLDNKTGLLVTLLECAPFYEYIKESLLDPMCPGAWVNSLHIDLKGTRATLWLGHEINDEIPNELEIDRVYLLELFSQWVSLIKKEAEEIAITRDGEIFTIAEVK